ncbi:uncharacterized exonuclease domain-containing protein At3g15140 isoform X2 [Syzygium oleosum]|uniref:uncharacterized exonuclease domain-containing protein At3g15140 isoform X2 n=1 Tax=Syzygium oleosum TaxID=219896 RepID=UPI0024BA494B|nr:uncharacterized exonuclease domain-containing protein At3g15140 isoform X2 [Syzygium oleosum]
MKFKQTGKSKTKKRWRLHLSPESSLCLGFRLIVSLFSPPPSSPPPSPDLAPSVVSLLPPSPPLLTCRVPPNPRATTTRRPRALVTLATPIAGGQCVCTTPRASAPRWMILSTLRSLITTLPEIFELVLLTLNTFVRPSQMSETRVNEYIEGKYGKFGVDRVWHDTAISFEEVIGEFETWLAQHHLWAKEQGGKLNRAAFVTCGNWDLKTKVPQQCKVSRIKLPGYFMEWINLKDVYLNFYHREARGMMAMMKQLDISVLGSHHLGMDDTKNIARVLQRMLVNGAVMRITAWRSPKSPDRIEFAYKNRI